MQIGLFVFLSVFVGGGAVPMGAAAADQSVSTERSTPEGLTFEERAFAQQFAGLSLSASGQYLVGFLREGPDFILAVWPSMGEPSEGVKLDVSARTANWIAWIGGDRLMMLTTSGTARVFDARTGETYPVNFPGWTQKALLPGLLAPMMSDPDHIVVQYALEEDILWPAVFKLNVKTGQVEQLVSARKPVVRWFTSKDGHVRGGEGFEDRTRYVYGRASDTESFALIYEGDFLEGVPFVPIYVENDGQTLAVLSGHASDRRELWRYDLAARSFEEGRGGRLAGHGRYDMASLITDPARGEVIGAGFLGERTEEILWDKDAAALSRRVMLEAGADVVQFSGASEDKKVRLFRLLSDTAPGWFAVMQGDEIREYGRPDFDLWPARTKKTVLIDGKAPMPIPAVLARPEEGVTVKGAVVLLHGGPLSRVSQNYHDLTALLTAQGYIVLAPNFRGSTGYGETWRRAGYGGWGTVMQEDVRDSAKWLVAQELVPREKICAVGASYGGYSALMAVIKDRSLFACAVSLNGVTSLPDLVSAFAKGRFGALSVPRIKGRLSDRTLRRRSPLFQVGAIWRPLLLVHGTNDQTVDFTHSARLALQLDRFRKPYRFVPLEGAGHVTTSTKYRSVFYEEMIRFLDENIGTDT